MSRPASWVALLALLAGVVLVGAAPAASAPTARPAAAPETGPAAPGSGEVFLVHALPDGDVSVVVDGAQRQTVAAGAVVGPLRLAAGSHRLTVTGRDPGWRMRTTVDVTAERSVDLVLHAPADASRRPVATAFRKPLGAVADGQARVLVAHTAGVPAADVEVDGAVAFPAVANGEFGTADVPAGPHQLRVLPAGEPGPALLGPLDLDTPAGTLTTVYATGGTAQDVDVVVHRQPLQARGSPTPQRVQTGSAGLVDGRVPAGLAPPAAAPPAAAPAAAAPAAATDGSGTTTTHPVLLGTVLAGLLALAGSTAMTRRVRHRARPEPRHRLA